ncbi:hypothetical protein SALBM217S_02546 [Streptomyces griseoloalbus]
MLGEPHPRQTAELGVVQDLPQRGFRGVAHQRQRLLAAQPPQRRTLVRAARRRQQLARRLQRPAPLQPVLGLGVGGGRRVRGGAVEQRVGALVREVADRGRLEARLQQPGAQPVQAERGQPHQAVAGDVRLVDGGGGLLVGVGHQVLVERLVLHQPDGLQHPELVVQPHHRVGHLLQDVVAGLRHAVGHEDGGGQRGQRHRGVARLVLADGQQIQVAEDPVEELRLGLRVPVQRVEVQLPRPLAPGDGVDQPAQVGHARVAQHRLQGAEPHAQHVLRRAAGEQRQLVARADGALLLVDHRDEPGVHGDPPGLAGVGRRVLPAQTQLRGRVRELLLHQGAAGVHPGRGTGPAGEPGGPGQHRSGQGVARQLRFGAQPRRRQDGAV